MPQKIRAPVFKHCASHQVSGLKLMQSAAELSSILLTSKPEALLKPSGGTYVFLSLTCVKIMIPKNVIV